MVKTKGYGRQDAVNQSMIDNDKESRNSVTGYKEESNPAEIAQAARVRTNKKPDKTDM